MSVLVACEFSGTVRRAFRERGIHAMSCDLLDAEDDADSGLSHLKGDALKAVAMQPWELLIAHPPCTYLTNAGARWLYQNGRGNIPDPARWKAMVEAADFFNLLKNAAVPRVCVENPIPHAHARKIIGAATQLVQPWMFGDYETKATCLWLRGLPPLVPRYKRIDECREALGLPVGQKPAARVHRASPGPDRWKERSRTYPGLARAFAEQWA